jgi:hypothetical protein
VFSFLPLSSCWFPLPGRTPYTFTFPYHCHHHFRSGFHKWLRAYNIWLFELGFPHLACSHSMWRCFLIWCDAILFVNFGSYLSSCWSPTKIIIAYVDILKWFPYVLL